MKHLLFFFSFFLCHTLSAQKTYFGIGVGGIYAQYKQTVYDNIKIGLSDSLKLRSPFNQNIKSPGISLCGFYGVEKAIQATFNFQFMFQSESEIDTLGRKFNLSQLSTNICLIGGLYLLKWFRLDAGIGVNYSNIKLKEVNSYYGEISSVKDDYYCLYLSPCIEFSAKDRSGGISFAPFCNLGITKFHFLDAFGYTANKSPFRSVGLDVKILFGTFD